MAFAPVMILPMVKVSVAFTVGVVLMVRSFDALLTTMLLNVVALVPPIVAVALVPVKVTVLVAWVKLPLLVQLPLKLPPPTLSAKAPFSTSVPPVLMVKSLRTLVVAAPSCTEGLPAVTTTRFQMFTAPPPVFVIRKGFPAIPPICNVPPVTFWVPDIMFTSLIELSPIGRLINPPDILKVVALPSTNVSWLFRPTVAMLIVPPVWVNVPADVVVALVMPPATVSVPPFIWKSVAAELLKVMKCVTAVPTFIVVPALSCRVPAVTATVVLIVRLLLTSSAPLTVRLVIVPAATLSVVVLPVAMTATSAGSGTWPQLHVPMVFQLLTVAADVHVTARASGTKATRMATIISFA